MEKNRNSKQKILEAATKLFAKKGYDGTSIREICKEANTNICMISYFFGSKMDLYKGIIQDLIEKQTQYAKSFLDFEQNPADLPKPEQIKILYDLIDKAIEILYTDKKFISDDLFRFLLMEQQNRSEMLISPSFVYIRKLIAAIFNKNMDDKEIIFRTVFIMAQINSPKILQSFSLCTLNQQTFIQEDIEIIRRNVKNYIKGLLDEEGIKC